MSSNQKNKYGIVNRSVITDPQISVGAKALYAVLCCYANKHRICWPMISTLADDLGSSQSSVDKWIRELKNHNYIERKGRQLVVH